MQNLVSTVTWCPGFVRFSLRQTVFPHHHAAPYSSGLAPCAFDRMVTTSKMQHKFKMLLTAQILVAVCSTEAKNINSAKKATNSQGC
jgi:hypothetical protein